jgi:hypothetical protein
MGLDRVPQVGAALAAARIVPMLSNPSPACVTLGQANLSRCGQHLDLQTGITSRVRMFRWI